VVLLRRNVGKKGKRSCYNTGIDITFKRGFQHWGKEGPLFNSSQRGKKTQTKRYRRRQKNGKGKKKKGLTGGRGRQLPGRKGGGKSKNRIESAGREGKRHHNIKKQPLHALEWKLFPKKTRGMA